MKEVDDANSDVNSDTLKAQERIKTLEEELNMSKVKDIKLTHKISEVTSALVSAISFQQDEVRGFKVEALTGTPGHRTIGTATLTVPFFYGYLMVI